MRLAAARPGVVSNMEFLREIASRIKEIKQIGIAKSAHLGGTLRRLQGDGDWRADARSIHMDRPVMPKRDVPA
jgi:hypothetical protein